MNRTKTKLSILGVALLVGCSGGDTPDLTTVEGTVTLDKKPLPNATVEFTPLEGGRPAVAITDDDGEYELEYSEGNYGAVPGEYTVSITTATTTIDADGNDVNVPEKVPAKYNAYTELTAEVKEGKDNEFNFDLDSQGEIYVEEDDDGGTRDSPSCF